MAEQNSLGFATRQIHAGKIKNDFGALVEPIYQTSTFEFTSVEQGSARFQGKEQGYIYSRLGNPTLTSLESRIADLEKGEACVATASGMGAISSCLYSLLSAGDEVLASDTLYGCTYKLLNQGFPRMGVKVIFTDFSDLEKALSLINERTKVVYLETPCNPTLKVIDIKSVSETVHNLRSQITVVVDNTFASPYLTQPLTLGADVVVHSGTKYINGHGDVIAGFVIGKKSFIDKVRSEGIMYQTGAVLSPFNAFLISRGLKTLDLRMERHCDNAERVATFLSKHPAVEKVYYPGLPGSPGHEIARRQMRRFGGMVSFELKGGRERVGQAVNKVKLITIAVSLGDAETLIEHPSTMTHAPLSMEELRKAGISEGLVRLSCGLENAEDIIRDLEQAFKGLEE